MPTNHIEGSPVYSIKYRIVKELIGQKRLPGTIIDSNSPVEAPRPIASQIGDTTSVCLIEKLDYLSICTLYYNC